MSNEEFKKVVIVESPTKARTISRILGRGYTVTASMGHVRDLPENSLGVNIAEGFKPYYQVTKPSVVNALKKQCKGAKEVYLAPDPDREGEAIAWHIRELLKDSTKTDFKRVVFHEITRSAVNEAFKHPGQINMNLVNSQQARRILDRIVGYKISEMLWSKIGKGLSAGRVQSVALRIVCDREREIQAFVPKEYWLLDAIFANNAGLEYKGRLSLIGAEKAIDISAEQAEKIAKALDGCGLGKVVKLENKKKMKYAPPPFITSTMQQAAVQSLRMTAAQTMRVAQQLYEGVEIGKEGLTGLITYMRTDSVSVAKEALWACRKFIETELGQEYLPEKPNYFKGVRGAQEAHEAIRPTDPFRKPENLKRYLTEEQYALYSLIWKRFIASQMKPAEYDVVSVFTEIQGKDSVNYTFKTEVAELAFAGFLKVYEVIEEENDEEKDKNVSDFALLKKLQEGEEVSLKKLEKEQKFTEPPPRFSEATLIRELEQNGIGRPSTYATILTTLLSRKYVERKKGRLVPTELGFKVVDTLIRLMPDLFQIGFTAEMEMDLDQIEEGKNDWHKMLSDFYSKFQVWLKEAKAEGAPSDEKAKKLISALKSVKNWEKSPIGAKKINDRRFFESVCENFKTCGFLSEKQWNALIKLAWKYRDQIENFNILANELGIEGELRTREIEETQKDDPAVKDMNAKLTKVVDELKKIALKEKTDTSNDKGSKYNDITFLNSFSKRLASGLSLTEKQIAVLKKILHRQKDKVANFAEIIKMIPQLSDENMQNKVVNDRTKIESLLNALKRIEGKLKDEDGRSDKKFFKSLLRQFEEKGELTQKQYAALEKMVSRYSISV